MARRKSVLVALKNLEKSYEQKRKALLRKAQADISATVERIVGELAGIAKDFPAAVSNAVASLVLAPVEGKAAPAKSAKAPAAVSSEGEAGGRFRAMGVKAHRAKLGLSADNYGKLVGVSGVTIYKWETGKNKPQAAQKAKWLAIRSLGKGEALQRLGTATPKAASAAAKKTVAAKAEVPKKRKRGVFRQTGEEMILSLLNGKKALTSEINAAWKQAGRGGSVNNTLGKMVKDKKLIRKSVEGERGSEYSVA